MQQHFDIGHSLSFEVCFTLIIGWRRQVEGLHHNSSMGIPYIYIYICVCVCIYIYIYIYIYILAGLPGIARGGEGRNRIEMLCIV